MSVGSLRHVPRKKIVRFHNKKKTNLYDADSNVPHRPGKSATYPHAVCMTSTPPCLWRTTRPALCSAGLVMVPTVHLHPLPNHAECLISLLLDLLQGGQSLLVLLLQKPHVGGAEVRRVRRRRAGLTGHRNQRHGFKFLCGFTAGPGGPRYRNRFPVPTGMCFKDYLYV